MVTELLDDVQVAAIRGSAATTPVSSVEYDSRQVGAGALFCCVPGDRSDGHEYAAEAVARGATALLCERTLDLDVTQVEVSGGVRPAMASVSTAFYGHPARTLAMVGVTGTNGKTTVTHLVRSVLESDGRPTGVIGTLDGARTTPEAPDLQRLLAGFRAEGRTAVAMEVSSHALVQERVGGLRFDVAAFTNLSRDHLDYHGTMEEYFAAKVSLFDPERCRHAVVFADDPWGARLMGMLDPAASTAVHRDDASDVELAAGLSRFTWRGRRVELSLSGRFNVDNALVAAAASLALGVDEDGVVEGLSTAIPVPGRMEVVAEDSPVAVFVDYAHTPDGLTTALGAARTLAGAASVICVFGCGGDRDIGKRPQMGAAAAHLADTVYLTSDNPRSEDPLVIIEQIQSGISALSGGAEVHVEPERRAAIRAAVAAAAVGDVVLIAGKGHEDTQIAAGRRIPFDDRNEAADALRTRFGGATS